MKLIHQVIKLTLLASTATSSHFIPHTKDGVYRYHPDLNKHVRLGPIKKSTGKIAIPVPQSSSANSKPNPRKVPALRNRQLGDSDGIDFDLLARHLLDYEDEDDDEDEEFQGIRFRDADPLGIMWGEGPGLHGWPLGPFTKPTPKSTKTSQAPSTTSSATQATPTASGLGGPGQGFVASETQCKDEIVSSDDFAAAYESLAIACGTGYKIKRNSHMYAVSGSAMVYTCSIATNWDDNPCQASEMWTAFTIIQNKCPNYRVGWSRDDKSYKSYGLELAGTGICGQKM